MDNKEIKEEFDNLARIMKVGLDEVNSKMSEGFRRVDEKIKHIDARLSNIEQDISEIKKHFVYRYEFEDLMARVKYLEGKLGVESGK